MRKEWEKKAKELLPKVLDKIVHEGKDTIDACVHVSMENKLSEGETRALIDLACEEDTGEEM